METTRTRDPFADLMAPSGTARPAYQPPRPPAVVVQRTPVGRRLLGVLVLLVLTALSLPVHLLTMFFTYVEVASPGDVGTAVLLVAGTGLASFLALLLTGTLAQVAGGFPGRWRARVTFAALSALLAVAVTAVAALHFF